MPNYEYKGSYVAIVTPFDAKGAIDFKGFNQLLEFQMEQGTTGIVPCGTTGESPGLNWPQNIQVIKITIKKAAAKGVQVIAGIGSNNTQEALHAAEELTKNSGEKPHAWLTVDPYYIKPSSRGARVGYYTPIAKAYPRIDIIPYIIPGRTQMQTLPVDIRMLMDNCPNVGAVKEATGDRDNMARIRSFCGEDLSILSGDDKLTYDSMQYKDISANGVISVIGNILPGPIATMVNLLLEKKFQEAEEIHNKLLPLFKVVSVSTDEETPYGPVPFPANNPLPIKALMNVLGMPAGICRGALDMMSKKGIKKVVKAAQEVYNKEPGIFLPIADCFRVDVEERLYDPKFQEGLYFEKY